MKLNTNRLFSTLKRSQNTCKNPKHLATRSDRKLNTQSNSNKNSNKKQNPSRKNNPKSPIINPFSYSSKKISSNKKMPNKKITSSKLQCNYFQYLKTEEDDTPDTNDFLPTDESDTKNQDDDFDIEALCTLFQTSNLKKTIIINNNGGNNINSEQTKFVKDYLEKKNPIKNVKRCSINTIKVQNYNHNNILLKQKNSQLNNVTNLKYKNIKLNNGYNTHAKNTVSSNLLKYNQFKELFQLDFDIDEMNSKNKGNKDNNSLFENITDKSLDSSFMGSSLAEEFLQTFDINTKN